MPRASQISLSYEICSLLSSRNCNHCWTSTAFYRHCVALKFGQRVWDTYDSSNNCFIRFFSFFSLPLKDNRPEVCRRRLTTEKSEDIYKVKQQCATGTLHDTMLTKNKPVDRKGLLPDAH